MIGELLTGVGILGRALRIILRRPKLFGLGTIPPLITSVLFLILLIALFTQLDDLVTWLTPFGQGWSPLVVAVRVAIGVALVVGSILILVISFSTITLALGFPLYDKISELVEEELGDAPVPREESLAVSAGRSLRQSLILISASIGGGIVFFVAGLIPVAGQVLGPVLSAIFGGWMLCIELVGGAFERRGHLRLNDRRAAMRGHRARVLGFAIPSFLLLAIPFVAIVVFPVATAGGTILARDLLGESRKVGDPAPRPRTPQS